MEHRGVSAVLLASMHNIAYYTGFLYCSFGRPYGCVVTGDSVTTVSANIDFGQPGRRFDGDNLVYTDWRRDNFYRAAGHLLSGAGRVGIEGDHVTLQAQERISTVAGVSDTVDISQDIMRLRMIKSAEEIALICEGARIADIGGEAIRRSIREGVREIDVAMAGRDAMELAIAGSYPESELRDTWVWFQSGINTDGAPQPDDVTNTRARRHTEPECLPHDFRIPHGA